MNRFILSVAIAKTAIEPTVFFHKDSVAVFPELKLVYNRVKKAGNTSVVASLHELADGKSFENSSAIKKNRSPWRLGLGDCLKLRSYQTLVVVRNPYVRCLSGYLDKIAPGRNQNYQNFPGFGLPPEEGLLPFLRYLEESDFSENRHFWPQCRLMIQPVSEFSHVAKLETLSSDMEVFLPKIGVSAEKASIFKQAHKLEKKDVNKITQSQNRIQEISSSCEDLIRQLYQEDFSSLNYSLEKSEA